MQEKMLNVMIPESLYSGFVESLIMNEAFLSVLGKYIEDGQLDMHPDDLSKKMLTVIAMLIHDMEKLHEGIVKTNMMNRNINPN